MFVRSNAIGPSSFSKIAYFAPEHTKARIFTYRGLVQPLLRLYTAKMYSKNYEWEEEKTGGEGRKGGKHGRDRGSRGGTGGGAKRERREEGRACIEGKGLRKGMRNFAPVVMSKCRRQ